VRSVLFRFPDLHAFERLMGAAGAGDLELVSPVALPVDDGEWLLAVFEVGPHRRAASAAARAQVGPDNSKIFLEPRDCRRLLEFARMEGGRPGQSADHPDSIAAPDTENDAPRTERSNTGAPPPMRPEAEMSAEPARLPEPSAPRGPLPSGAGARVMVVDDEADIRDMVAAMLEAVGLIVTTAGSAEEALTLLRGSAFDLVVLDWNMPRMSGIDLCRALRQKAAYAALPVLFLTANTSSSDMVEAFAAGADDYVVKPFRAPELGARIFSLLRRARFSGAGT
jgi:two-component system, OmpR family, phosphate regulon response regulator PhoB